MRARPRTDADQVVFDCIGGRNMIEIDGHMHRAEWRFADHDHVSSIWTFRRDGVDEAPYRVVLERVVLERVVLERVPLERRCWPPTGVQPDRTQNSFSPSAASQMRRRSTSMPFR